MIYEFLIGYYKENMQWCQPLVKCWNDTTEKEE